MISSEQKSSIAIIGAGVAGIVSAYLLQRKHRVTLFERNDYLGGHTNTVVTDEGVDAGTAVDTGFIVLNDRTYPLFNRFLSRLGVFTRNSDMSFGYWCERSGLQYAGTGWNGIFAQRFNLFRPAYWMFLRELIRFNRTARHDLNEGKLEDQTLGEYLQQNRFSQSMIDNYLVPMGSAIWSMAPNQMLQFPAASLVRFFENHGLLSVSDHVQWKTVAGGSHTYVQVFMRDFKGSFNTQTKVKTVKRNPENVEILLDDGSVQTFDQVVIATHADEALQLLNDPSADETRLLGAWTYSKNHTVLHTDPSVMPPNRRAWASWNYTRENLTENENAVSVTYHMNRLQGLQTKEDYFVTLNRKGLINPQRVIREILYTHPTYTFEAIRSQPELPKLNGVNRTYFCGSYFRYGFHEDAVMSAVEVGRAFGEEL